MKMKYGYDLSKEQSIFSEKIILFDYKKKPLTDSQRRMLEDANSDLFAEYKNLIPIPPTVDREVALIDRTPNIILSEVALMLRSDTSYSENEITTFQPRGIAKKFSQLKTTSDILSFANTYGLLGCKLIVSPLTLNHPNNYIDYFSYSHSYFEPLIVWKWHIEHVSKLFQLYRALKYKTKIEDDLLSVEISQNAIDIPTPGHGLIFWNDGKLVDIAYLESKNIDYNKIARTVLMNQLRKMLKGAIDLSFESIEDDENSELGFSINEKLRTRYLLGAIYYDLWYTIKNHHDISICQYRYCNSSFSPHKRREYCSDACKQAEYRLRRKEKERSTDG